MAQAAQLKHGDFTHLAEDYAKYRPGYSDTALEALLAMVQAEKIDFADVGAGTGIWTRMVAAHPRVKSAIGVEPNDNMRAEAEAANKGHAISWQKGSGEETGLKSGSVDLLTMASSFHWVDFDKGMQEFARVIRPGGRFVALWNPRYIQDNPVLVDIEKKAHELAPNMKRVSSGKSKFVEELTEKFLSLDTFDDLTFIEGRHTVQLTHEQYIGAWNSVNDIQFQLGEHFSTFMNYIEEKIADLPHVDSTYLTRAWSIRRK